MDTNIFTQRLKEAREKEGLSLKELQARVGISLSALNNYVAGRTVPPLDVAVKLAKELHVSLDWLSGIDGSDTASVIKVSNCYETACVLDQIVDLYSMGSITAEEYEPIEAFHMYGITLRIDSDALYEYYLNKDRLTQFKKALPVEMRNEYLSQSEILLKNLRETLRTTGKTTGLKMK